MYKLFVGIIKIIFIKVGQIKIKLLFHKHLQIHIKLLRSTGIQSCPQREACHQYYVSLFHHK
jgi:hypothetical protein